MHQNLHLMNKMGLFVGFHLESEFEDGLDKQLNLLDSFSFSDE